MKKGVIIVISVILIGIIGTVVYYNSTQNKTREELIKENFLNDIALAKKGEATEEQKYLLCSDENNCENIEEFNIDNVELYRDNTDGSSVYKIKISWSCKEDGMCFYNEQPSFNEDTNLYEVETHYSVSSDNKIIECLGNVMGGPQY